MEDLLINISLGNKICVCDCKHQFDKFSGVTFIALLKQGKITHINAIEMNSKIMSCSNVKFFIFKLKQGEKIVKITNSLDRYGQIVMQENSREKLMEALQKGNVIVNKCVQILNNR